MNRPLARQAFYLSGPTTFYFTYPHKRSQFRSFFFGNFYEIQLQIQSEIHRKNDRRIPRQRNSPNTMQELRHSQVAHHHITSNCLTDNNMQKSGLLDLLLRGIWTLRVLTRTQPRTKRKHLRGRKIKRGIFDNGFGIQGLRMSIDQ